MTQLWNGLGSKQKAHKKMFKRYIKNYSPSLAIKEIEITAPLWFHLTSVKMTKNNWQWALLWLWRKRNHIHHWCERNLVRPPWTSIWRILRNSSSELLLKAESGDGTQVFRLLGQRFFPAESSHQSLAFKSHGTVGLLGDWKAGESLLNGKVAAVLSTARFWWEPPHTVSLTLSPASQDTSSWCHQACGYLLSNFLLIITYSDLLTD